MAEEKELSVKKKHLHTEELRSSQSEFGEHKFTYMVLTPCSSRF